MLARPRTPQYRTAWIKGYQAWCKSGDRPKRTGPKMHGWDAAANQNEQPEAKCPTYMNAGAEYEALNS
jgi:hypothetical protein